ncbi:F0F1 ATP synthase subunit A [Candidatus Gracilibacteria bacterium]|nr:F0F1 ATP synthase subunit A [Candidatus Gracilibacteria bacterium]NUJ98840.1 F0F1 ATP synthase subunit A [Candidatus Gracilibacteria bacterium]
MEEFLPAFLDVYKFSGVFNGLLLELGIVLILIISFNVFKNSGFVTFFDMLFEKAYDFFEELLGVEEKRGPKLFIISLFFVILFSNLLGILLEFFVPIFGHEMEHYIKIPTSDINFNLGMAICAIFYMLFQQMSHLGFGHFVYEYFPLLGKNYIPFERGKLPIFVDIPLFILIKAFDIVISVFLGLLEIIGILAKIISLSFRLFGNITSGGALLMMIFTILSGMTMSLVKFEFPIIIPIIVYIQELMVAFIQAFVFPLLVAIFIKVAKLH